VKRPDPPQFSDPTRSQPDPSRSWHQRLGRRPRATRVDTDVNQAEADITRAELTSSALIRTIWAALFQQQH